MFQSVIELTATGSERQGVWVWYKVSSSSSSSRSSPSGLFLSPLSFFSVQINPLADSQPDLPNF